ncbi:LysR family transcriptional regulator [Vibrio sp. RE86]|uniref:LysR family transcriptional regulator n=1 Tax=Vibrio sp. RE86 TaxID=2607605 RepID=UPI00149378F1|nr:LysR family transcriptional regulator [Vibrio sp. RE86]NOH79059.1 LysR family transcriptional regulator [Vibrio sp. RE86]
MAKDLFYSLDLNLLRTFLVLSQELNMRKASQRLFVSQPAISQSLQKLRHHFDDELFVKVPKGLEATSFAEQLAQAIAPHLDGLAGALNQNESFDPKELTGSIKIAVAPIVLTCLSGTLFPRFREHAPNCMIELVGWSKDTFTDIQKGDVLFGVNLDLSTPQNVSAKKLVELRGQLIVRKDHPLKKKTATAFDMEPYPIASVITPGWNDNFAYAAEIMKQEGANPNIGFRSEFVMAVVDVIQHTDFFLPHSNLFPVQNFPNLKAIDVLIQGQPYHHQIYSYYHNKYRHNPLIHWVYQQILAVLEEQITNK